MNTMRDCDNLKPYIMEELAPEDRKRFESHLPGCTPCSRALAADRAIRNALAALPRVAAPHRFTEQVMANVTAKQRSRTAWMVYAASVMVLAVLTTMLATGSLGPLATEGSVVLQAVLDTGAALYTVVRNVSAALYHGLNFGQFTPVVLTVAVLILGFMFLRSLAFVSTTRRN